jgi:hypothetical protein
MYIALLLLLMMGSSALADTLLFRENFWYNDLNGNPNNAPLSIRRWNGNYGATAVVVGNDQNQSYVAAVSYGNQSVTYLGEPLRADPEYFDSYEKPSYGFVFVANNSEASNPATALWTEQWDPDLGGVNQAPLPLASTISKVGWFGNERTGTDGADFQMTFMMKLNGQWYVNANTVSVNATFTYYTTNISLSGSQWKAMDFVPGSSLTQDIGSLSVVGGTLADGQIQAFGVYMKPNGISGQTGYWGRLDTLELYTPEPATMSLLGLGVIGLLRRR